MSDMSHLSVVDGAFLHLESPEMPMHVGALSVYELPARYRNNTPQALAEKLRPWNPSFS